VNQKKLMDIISNGRACAVRYTLSVYTMMIFVSSNFQCELRVKNFRMNKNKVLYIPTGFDNFLKVVKSDSEFNS